MTRKPHRLVEYIDMQNYLNTFVLKVYIFLYKISFLPKKLLHL